METMGFLREERVMGALWRPFIVRDFEGEPCVAFTWRLSEEVEPKAAVFVLYEDFRAMALGECGAADCDCPVVVEALAEFFEAAVCDTVLKLWGPEVSRTLLSGAARLRALRAIGDQEILAMGCGQ